MTPKWGEGCGNASQFSLSPPGGERGAGSVRHGFAPLDAASETEWQKHVLDAALGRLARRVPAKHFQVFDLYSRQGWTVLRVSRELGINPAAVYLISHRLTKQLKAEVAALSSSLD